MSRVHTPCATGGSMGIGEHSEWTWASSAPVDVATIVLGSISVPQRLKTRDCRNALVSDASGKGNARRWTLEGRRREGANVMPVPRPLPCVSGHWVSMAGGTLRSVPGRYCGTGTTLWRSLAHQ